MGYHNETCGCPDCGNYGWPYNPHAIHNQSCGCAECGNYPLATTTRDVAALRERDTELIAVPVELLDEIRALIAKSRV